MTHLTIRFILILVFACALSIATFVVLSIVSQRWTLAPETLEKLVELGDTTRNVQEEHDPVLKIKRLGPEQVKKWIEHHSLPTRSDELTILVPADNGYFSEFKVHRSDVDHAIQVADRSLLVGASIVFAIFGLTAIILAWPLVSRIQIQEQAITKLADGDLSARVHVKRNDALGRLSTRINSMADRIQELIHSHETLLQTVSHEMRTPISRIHFSLQLLSETIAETNNESADVKELEMRFETIRTDMAELDQLLDELLTYSRLKSSEKISECEPVVLQTMLQRIVTQQSRGYPSIKVQLINQDKSIAVQATEKLLQRALDNVVRNACRFASSRVALDVRRTEEDTIIEIADDGPGIPESELVHVFQPFVQLTSKEKNGAGNETGIGFGVGSGISSGLGLSIAKQIIELHGGSISFVECNQGARCIIILS